MHLLQTGTLSDYAGARACTLLDRRRPVHWGGKGAFQDHEHDVDFAVGFGALYACVCQNASAHAPVSAFDIW